MSPTVKTFVAITPFSQRTVFAPPPPHEMKPPPEWASKCDGAYQHDYFRRTCGLCAGTAWVYSTRYKFSEDPNDPTFCHPTLYWYAFWIITTGWITIGFVIVVGGILVSCALCCSGDWLIHAWIHRPSQGLYIGYSHRPGNQLAASWRTNDYVPTKTQQK